MEIALAKAKGESFDENQPAPEKKKEPKKTDGW